MDDVFVRRDLHNKYKVEKRIAEEFLGIYSFDPVLEDSVLTKDELWMIKKYNTQGIGMQTKCNKVQMPHFTNKVFLK